VIYSTTARTSLPFRVVGYIQSTQATAGTWATAPSTIQGQGGQALAAMSSLGYGQTWQTVTRTSTVTYYNTTGKPIVCNLNASLPAAQSVSVTVNGTTVGTLASSASNTNFTFPIIIPISASYVITGTISFVYELR